MPFSLEHDLSEELLDSIVVSCSQSSQAALARSSKKLQRIATPHLYSSISFGNAYPDVGIIYLLPFAYLIFSSPFHAALVHSLAIRDSWGEDAPPSKKKNIHPKDNKSKRPWPNSGSPELETVLKTKCSEYAINNNEAEEIYEKMKSGANESIIIALLLANLPNLRTLDVSIGYGDERDEFFILVTERVAERKQPFDKLPSGPIDFSTYDKSNPNPIPFSGPIDVLCTGDNDKYPNDPDIFAGFFYLPNLRSIYGYKMGDEDGEPAEESAFTKLKPGSCPVEYIEARTSKLHRDNLKLLMNASIPGNLKTFNYEIGCTWAWCNVDHDQIMKSLEAHYDTLEQLGLSHEDFYPYQFDNEEENPCAVTFHNFKILKKLKVAPVYIWGHEGFATEEGPKKPQAKEMLWKALPESLEQMWVTRAEAYEEGDAEARKKLVVRFIPDCLIPALELVVQHQSEAFPKLSEIRVEFPLEEWEDDWIDLFASFCKNAEGSGISCTVILTSAIDYTEYDGREIPQRGWGWDEELQFAHCIHNEETPKIWIEVGKELDLARRLREINAVREEKKRAREEQRKRNAEEREREKEEEEDHESEKEGGVESDPSEGDQEMEDGDDDEYVEEEAGEESEV